MPSHHNYYFPVSVVNRILDLSGDREWGGYLESRGNALYLDRLRTGTQRDVVLRPVSAISGGGNYVGDIHYHPNGILGQSAGDKAYYVLEASLNHDENKPYITAIVGHNKIKVWAFSQAVDTEAWYEQLVANLNEASLDTPVEGILTNPVKHPKVLGEHMPDGYADLEFVERLHPNRQVDFPSKGEI